uniref:Uncharacterized protein n=1 Tax=Tanacetum cinerariifolium TaxID=118510 RepID=A0A6L2LIV6_TANCI|nr:hypothetical protein [Tanacetum cinerariifolium]
MFQDILQLPVETPKNPFVTLVNTEIIEAFMNKVGYQGFVDKVSAFYTKNLAQPWQTVFKVFNRCLTTRTSGHDQTKINILQMFHAVINHTNKILKIPKRIEEDYHFIKDGIPLVSVYIIGDVRVRGMLISDAFLSKEIRATDDFKEYETVFMTIDVPMNQPQPEIEKMVEGDEDEESYASEFVDSVLNDDVDDSDTRLEPESEKENLEKNNDNVEETDKVVKEKDIINDVTGSTKIRKELKQTPIPSPTRSPRNVSTSDKIVSEKLTATVSPTTATTSKASSTTKHKKQSISSNSKTLPRSIASMCRRHSLIRSHIKNKFVTHNFFMSKIREVLDHCNKVVPDTTFTKTKEIITQEMPSLVNLTINNDHEIDPINA